MSRFMYIIEKYVEPQSWKHDSSGPGIKPAVLWQECLVWTAGLTNNVRHQGILIRVKYPGGPHLNTKTCLHPIACKHHCWKPQAKHLVTQEHSPTHQGKKKKKDRKLLQMKEQINEKEIGNLSEK